MRRRTNTSSRRAEIVEATLHLLGSTPLAELTTRRIARQLGLSQPALFRHFRSREQLLVAAVGHARGALGERIERAMGEATGALEQIDALVRGLLLHVEEHPGLPRLLFSDALQADSELSAALRQLMTMPIKLVAELVRQAQRDGALDTSLSAERYGSLLVALIQGVSLQWQRGVIAPPLVDTAEPLIGLWLDGARRRGAVPTRRASEPVPPPGLETLDVRPILAGGEDPLDHILAALDRVGPRGVLLLTAAFRPAPLLGLVTGRGCRALAVEVDEQHWEVEIAGPEAPPVEDLRDLPAPEPLERVLEATAQLAPGDVFLAHVPRHPRLLAPRLAERGLSCQVAERHDGSALIGVMRPA